MSEKKVSTLIIEVDLGNICSYKKIQKILCDLQISEQIKTISFDDKKNTVTISGPFDAEKLRSKISHNACKVNLCIKITVPPEKPPPPPPPPPPEPPRCRVINNIKITVDSKDVTCEETCEKTDSCHRPDCSICCRKTYCVTYPGGCRRCSCGRGHGCEGHGP